MSSAASPDYKIILAIAILTWAGFLLVRATGPDDLLSRDQVKVGSYTLDIIENDNWLWQQDHAGQFASKPPMTQWLAALFTRATGQFHRMTLTFPSWFGCLITLIIICAWTRREFGSAAALWVPLLLLANPMGLRAVLLARSDPLFQCTIVLLAFAVWRCWIDGARAWPIVLAGTAALLTKGPLGLIIGLLGLLAVFTLKKEERPPIPAKIITIAILLSLVVPALWLWSAEQSSGGAAVEKLLQQELLGHAVGARLDPLQQSWTHHLLPAGWFLSRLAPTGLIALIAIARMMWRRSAQEQRQRTAERFLLAWLLGGLLLLCIGTHHRFIHLLVILPPAAMLAAREVSGWLSTPARGPMWAAVALSGVLPLTAVYLDMIDISSPRIVRSREVKEFALSVQEEVGPGARLVFFPTSAAVQVQLGRHQPALADQDIGGTLQSDEAIYVIVEDEDRFRRLATSQGITVFEAVLRRPFDGAHLALFASKGAVGARRVPGSRHPDYVTLTLLSILTGAIFVSSVRFLVASIAPIAGQNSKL